MTELDLDDYFPYLINRVGFALVSRYQRALDPHGLSIAMWRVLAALSTRGEQRQVDLARMTSIDASTLSRMLGRCARMGLIARTRSPASNREMVVRLSPKGRNLVDRLIPVARRLEQEAIAGLPARQLGMIREALRRMYDNLEGGAKAPKQPRRAAP